MDPEFDKASPGLSSPLPSCRTSSPGQGRPRPKLGPTASSQVGAMLPSRVCYVGCFKGPQSQFRYFLYIYIYMYNGSDFEISEIMGPAEALMKLIFDCDLFSAYQSYVELQNDLETSTSFLFWLCPLWELL